MGSIKWQSFSRFNLWTSHVNNFQLEYISRNIKYTFDYHICFFKLHIYSLLACIFQTEFIFLFSMKISPLHHFVSVGIHVFKWHCTKKWSFSLRTSSVNVTKSSVSCRFGHIYRRNPQWKDSFFVQCENMFFPY